MKISRVFCVLSCRTPSYHQKSALYTQINPDGHFTHSDCISRRVLVLQQHGPSSVLSIIETRRLELVISTVRAPLSVASSHVTTSVGGVLEAPERGITFREKHDALVNSHGIGVRGDTSLVLSCATYIIETELSHTRTIIELHPTLHFETLLSCWELFAGVCSCRGEPLGRLFLERGQLSLQIEDLYTTHKIDKSSILIRTAKKKKPTSYGCEVRSQSINNLRMLPVAGEQRCARRNHRSGLGVSPGPRTRW